MRWPTRREHGGDLETAALRVFGNAEGAYGSNVNQPDRQRRWEDEDELAETYSAARASPTAAAAARCSRRRC
jgi:cobalamin biosynthesis Mg chelatase CobN